MIPTYLTSGWYPKWKSFFKTRSKTLKFNRAWHYKFWNTFWIRLFLFDLKRLCIVLNLSKAQYMYRDKTFVYQKCKHVGLRNSIGFLFWNWYLTHVLNTTMKLIKNSWKIFTRKLHSPCNYENICIELKEHCIRMYDSVIRSQI